jgi:hypothetical protein
MCLNSGVKLREQRIEECVPAGERL